MRWSGRWPSNLLGNDVRRALDVHVDLAADETREMEHTARIQ
jgi:hypothetical protein